MIEFVLLDLDDTILDFSYAEREALRSTLCRFGIDATDAAVTLYSEINDAHWKRLERGELTRREVQIGRFSCFLEAMGASEVSAEEANAFYMRSVADCAETVSGAMELLEALKTSGLRLFAVSNGSRSVQVGRIARSGIAPYFEEIFLSEDLGVEKPKREFFDLCFARIRDFDPTRAIVFGDSLTSDIQGGLNAGLLTCWFNRRGKARTADIVPHYEVSTLDAFATLLKTL